MTDLKNKSYENELSHAIVYLNTEKIEEILKKLKEEAFDDTINYSKSDHIINLLEHHRKYQLEKDVLEAKIDKVIDLFIDYNYDFSEGYIFCNLANVNGISKKTLSKVYSKTVNINNEIITSYIFNSPENLILEKYRNILSFNYKFDKNYPVIEMLYNKMGKDKQRKFMDIAKVFINDGFTVNTKLDGFFQPFFNRFLLESNNIEDILFFINETDLEIKKDKQIILNVCDNKNISDDDKIKLLNLLESKNIDIKDVIIFESSPSKVRDFFVKNTKINSEKLVSNLLTSISSVFILKSDERIIDRKLDVFINDITLISQNNKNECMKKLKEKKDDTYKRYNSDGDDITGKILKVLNRLLIETEKVILNDVIEKNNTLIVKSKNRL